MKTIHIDVYTFEELDDKAKEKARDWYREGIETEFWSEPITEDAKEIGLDIQEWDLDRGSYVKGRFIESAEETAHKIQKNHGESCETYQDAKNYLKERDEIINTAERDENGDLVNEYELDQKLDEIDEEFLKTLCEDYRIMLTKQMEYDYSDESVDENIIANEYTFTKTGKREG